MAHSNSAEFISSLRGSARFVLQSAGVSTALGIIAVLLAWQWGSPAIVRGVGYGCLLSLFLITSGYVAIRWAFHRPAKTFYGVVMGGMLLRFIIIGISLVLVRQAEGVHIYGFVGAVMASYILLQIFEVRFIQAELRSQSNLKGKKSTV